MADVDSAVSLSGAVFIDRKNRHDAVKAFEQVADAMKTKGVSGCAGMDSLLSLQGPDSHPTSVSV